MDPITAPLEPTDVVEVRREASADAIVLGAWTEHREELYALLVRTTHDRDVAEDLLQDAYLRLTREARAGRTPENVRAWLYRVATNLATSRGRRVSSAVRWLAGAGRRGAGTDPSEPPEAGLLRREGRAELLGLLDGLGPDARAALLLSSEGFHGDEIAAAIGRTPAATRTLLTRTRMRLRSRLVAGEV